ncbi:M50 family metallopeptidase [Corynebacterium pelargi]|uniref:Zinc metalloprotease Rip1 n=1 Tax=Corynebacterium pelargi TaxID=1471400 RepID=A0A410W860_9CORY|nr:site-2 protease family protein [Corynebacterium pelargi]QAU52134.1 Zinc metalloprotease Rip1 [Corynebacterium pelargi]GGG69913.1 Zn-dependent protease [Corynebacterium pelargi]
MGSYLLGVALFALGIAVTIALHELGHLMAARSFGMRVRRYFVGFGPTVWSWRKGHTEYGLKAVPLGGFCDIAGMTNQDEVTAEEAPHAMRNKPWWQRVIVLLGGIIMNVLITLVLIYGVAVGNGLPNPNVDLRAHVGELGCVPARQIDARTLSECQGTGPAEEAGLQVGDTILAVEGQATPDFPSVAEAVRAYPGQTITLDIDRDGQTMQVPVQVAAVERLTTSGESKTVGAIGVSSAPPKDVILQYGPAEAVPATLRFSGELLKATGQGLAAFPAKIPGVAASIFGAERDKESPMSVVGASRVGGELAQRDSWATFLMLLANLNLFLALFNLVPLPPLDGGHIAVVLYEVIRDRIRKMRGLAPAGPADYTKLMPLTVTVAGLLLTIGVVVIIADVVNPVRIFG